MNLHVSEEAVKFMERELFEAGILLIPVSEYNPDFEQLIADHREGKGYAFTGGECERTIFHGDKHAQQVFRVWHDNIHATLGHDFSKQGEIKVALEIADRLFAANLPNDAEILSCDLWAHIEYYHAHGEHPVNQLEMLERLFNKEFTLKTIPGEFH